MNKKPSKCTEKVLEAIPAFIGRDSFRQRELGMQQDLIPNLVKLMRIFEEESDAVCLKGLLAMRFLCNHGKSRSTSCEEIINTLGNAGACQLVAVILHDHRKNAAIVEQVCGRFLCYNVMRLHDIELAPCAGIQLTSGNWCLLETRYSQVCWVIRNLAFVDCNREKLGISGTCKGVVVVLQLHGRNNADVTVAVSIVIHVRSSCRSYNMLY
jgi:hypothetical protein